ncbi:MAG: protein-L-isoaspartate(D-aspartate) O-methyltransferase [Alphaproteobacteria bacterium]
MDPQRQMVEEIEAEVRETQAWLGKNALDPRVMAAMAKVPRHEFVPPDEEHLAYVNAPLPIGHGQTISQPYIVAVMTDMVAPEDDHMVLEVGAGSGYQAAILAEVVKQVYTIEIVPALAEQAREALTRLGYANVALSTGDGRLGWAEHAPFDAIVVTAAARKVPPALIDQLKPGGRMAIPIGGRFMSQDLTLVEKAMDGKVSKRSILPVAFVPLVKG